MSSEEEKELGLIRQKLFLLKKSPLFFTELQPSLNISSYNIFDILNNFSEREIYKLSISYNKKKLIYYWNIGKSRSLYDKKIYKSTKEFLKNEYLEYTSSFSISVKNTSFDARYFDIITDKTSPHLYEIFGEGVFSEKLKYYTYYSLYRSSYLECAPIQININLKSNFSSQTIFYKGESIVFDLEKNLEEKIFMDLVSMEGDKSELFNMNILESSIKNPEVEILLTLYGKSCIPNIKKLIGSYSIKNGIAFYYEDTFGTRAYDSNFKTGLITNISTD